MKATCYGNPLQYSCLENLMDRGAWQAAVRGVTKSQTGPSNWAHSHTCFPTSIQVPRNWFLVLVTAWWFIWVRTTGLAKKFVWVFLQDGTKNSKGILAHPIFRGNLKLQVSLWWEKWCPVLPASFPAGSWLAPHVTCSFSGIVLPECSLESML